MSDSGRERKEFDGRWLAIGFAVLIAFSAWAAVFMHEI